MADLSATAVVEVVQNLSQKNKLILLSVAPTTTSDVLTFDQSTSGLMIKCGMNFNKVVSAQAFDSSTGMPKAISSNGSTVLTTVGWTVGDNKWFIWIVAQNNFGEVA